MDRPTLVKTFGPRGTVHLLPAADLPLWTGALSAVPTGPTPFPGNARMTPDRVEAVVAAVGDALTGAELTIDEVTFGEDGPAWVAAGDTDFPDAPVRGGRLLPYFDAFAIASAPRERLFPGAAWERALGGGQAGNFPVLLVDGVVAGVWHQRRSGRRIAVTVEPLKPLSGARLRDLEEQVERVAGIMEGTAELTVGQVTVGPHA